MAPPQLARDAPVVHVVDPIKVTRRHLFRFNLHATVAHCISGSFCEWCNFDEPLLR